MSFVTKLCPKNQGSLYSSIQLTKVYPGFVGLFGLLTNEYSFTIWVNEDSPLFGSKLTV